MAAAAQAKPAKQAFVWNAQDSAAANDKKLYLRVGPGGTKALNKTRPLTGAERTWRQSPDVVYIPSASYRLSGTPDDIRLVLAAAGGEAGSIERILSSAITLQNYKVPAAQGGTSELFSAEVKAYRAMNKTNAGIPVSEFDLSVCISLAEQYREIKKQDKGKPAGKGVAKRARPAVTKKSIHDHVLDVVRRNEKKGLDLVLDVSGLSSGQPVMIVKRSQYPALASGKCLPIVSSNLESYVAAISELNPDGQDPHVVYADDIKAVTAALSSGVSAAPASVVVAAPAAFAAAPVAVSAAPVAVVSAAPVAVVSAAPAAAVSAAPAAKALPRVKSPVAGAGGARRVGIKTIGANAGK